MTRPTHPERFEPTFATAASSLSSRNPPTRSAIRNDRDPPGGPQAFDKEDYKGRNVVERNFNIFKQWPALATRCDKLALTYCGGAVLRPISIWLTALGEHALDVPVPGSRLGPASCLRTSSLFAAGRDRSALVV